MKIYGKTIIQYIFLGIIIYFILEDLIQNTNFSKEFCRKALLSQQERKFVILANKTNNVCYLNCIIQSFLPFKNYFMRYEGVMADILKNIFRIIQNTKEFNLNLVSGYKKILNTLRMNKFTLFAPGDAMELVHFILNHIIFHHVKLRNIRTYNRFYIHKKDLERLKSIAIIKDFCSIVEFEYNDYVWFMPVIVSRFHGDSIQTLIDEFFSFGKEKNYMLKNVIYTPNVLIISFWKRLGASKDLDFQKQEHVYLKNTKYKLNSLIMFVKNTNNGHYFSCSLVKDEWYMFDEDKIIKMELRNFNTGFVAMAIYEKII
ncbi:hypothetical protein H312_00653 [Anncaliia algerae PRA339]|uniref:USP domain-containing protein n=1 Tax=Anncaliia algerae PRA339 TaxID=1288291 RepID=A0A059F4G2_9MICR|nr:hypothetical protein H312_00653 [Anncaliia algerae PRA339]